MIHIFMVMFWQLMCLVKARGRLYEKVNMNSNSNFPPSSKREVYTQLAQLNTKMRGKRKINKV